MATEGTAPELRKRQEELLARLLEAHGSGLALKCGVERAVAETLAREGLVGLYTTARFPPLNKIAHLTDHGVAAALALLEKPPQDAR